MAQTLNPRASEFRPHPFYHGQSSYQEDFEFFLPDHLLISPNNSSVGRFDPTPAVDYPYSHSSSAQGLHKKMSLDIKPWDQPWESSFYYGQKLEAERSRNSCSSQYRSSNDPFLARSQSSRSYNRSPRNFHPDSNCSRTPRPNNFNSHPSTTPPKYAAIARTRTPMRPQVKVAQKPVQIQTLPTPVAEGYDADCLLHLVRSQLEFYFSDKNLFQEIHSNLQYYMKLDEKRWVPLHVVCSLPAIRKLKASKEVVLKALRSSTLLELDVSETLVRRPNYVPPPDFQVRKNLRRSVIVYGVPKHMTDEQIRNLLDMHGNILCVAFTGMDEGPEPEIGCIIMKKKLGETVDFAQLKTAFVVFESQSQANKCVKSRSRSSADGIRTMHKYDYNKVIKRLGKGVSPLFTPTHSPLNTMSGMSGISNYNGMASGFQLSPMATHRSSVNNSNRINNTSRQAPFLRKSASWNVSASKADSSLDWRSDNKVGLMQARSSSALNRRVVHPAKGSQKSFRGPFKKHMNTFDILNGTAI